MMFLLSALVQSGIKIYVKYFANHSTAVPGTVINHRRDGKACPSSVPGTIFINNLDPRPKSWHFGSTEVEARVKLTVIMVETVLRDRGLHCTRLTLVHTSTPRW